MTRSSENLDPRILRTRRALKNALLELIPERGYRNITVKQIAERAGLNRSTFYLHYQNLDDLLASEIGPLRDLLLGILLPPTSRSDKPTTVIDGSTVREKLHKIRESAPLYQVILGRSVAAPLRQQLFEDLLKNQGETAPARTAPQEGIFREFKLTFLVSGYLGILEWWLGSSCALTPHQMAELIEILLGSQPAQALESAVPPERGGGT